MEQYSPQIQLGCKHEGFFFPGCHVYTSPPEKQHCTYKLLSWELHTLQLQECMHFAHRSYSSAPPRASEDLRPISSIPKQQQQRKGKEQRPPHQIRHPLPVPGSFCLFPCREVMSHHPAASSPSRHRGRLSMRTDSSSTILILDISSILVWALYLF